MIEVKDCPVCGANSFKEVFKAPYFRGDGELFNISECDNCKLWVTSPRPEDIGKYYETEDYISHTDNKKSVLDYAYHWVRSIALKSKLKLINSNSPKKGNLLDYGAGTAHFLNTAKDDGWNVAGIEPSEAARENAKKNLDIDLTDPSHVNWESFKGQDCITLWHVLEHLPDLNEHLVNFNHALVDGGCLTIAVPNHESHDSGYYKQNWAALDVPLHLWHFKKSNMKLLADKHGFDLVEIRNMPFDSYYVSLLSEKIKGKSSKPLSAFWRGFVSNRKGMSQKNASSLIYILKKR
jgi:SAM-dependent methyltransferase